MKTNFKALSKSASTLTRCLGKAQLFVKSHKAEILMVTGAISTLAGTVAACDATLKAKEALEAEKENFDVIREARETLPTEKYSDKDYAHDLTVEYVTTAFKIGKIYAPAVILLATGIGSMFASNNMMRKKYAELGAAYATLDKMFKSYRKNVVEKYGEEVDKEMRYGVKSVKVEETVVDENGKEKKVKTTKKVCNIDMPSDYARFFDESCTAYQTDTFGNPAREANKHFLLSQQRAANKRLEMQGYLFLNDVYRMLGFEETKAGWKVGWVYESERGDSAVSFGIYNTTRANRRFVNGYEDVVLLDFNVDGVIIDSPELKLAEV